MLLGITLLIYCWCNPQQPIDIKILCSITLLVSIHCQCPSFIRFPLVSTFDNSTLIDLTVLWEEQSEDCGLRCQNDGCCRDRPGLCCSLRARTFPQTLVTWWWHLQPSRGNRPLSHRRFLKSSMWVKHWVFSDAPWGARSSTTGSCCCVRLSPSCIIT